MSSQNILNTLLITNPELSIVREFAAKKHAEVNQTYDGLPYVEGHLDKVVITTLKYTKKIELLKAAYGHDLKEDTKATDDEIIRILGARSAHIVTLLTDGPGETRFERQFLTYVNMRNDQEAILIKICDRITNISQSFGTRHALVYISEHERFKGSLYSKSPITEQAWLDLESLYKSLKKHIEDNIEDCKKSDIWKMHLFLVRPILG